MLEDRVRALLYFSLVMIALALIATSRLFDEGGLGVLVWLDADRRGRVRLRRRVPRRRASTERGGAGGARRAGGGAQRRAGRSGRPGAVRSTFVRARDINVGLRASARTRPTFRRPRDIDVDHPGAAGVPGDDRRHGVVTLPRALRHTAP